MFWNYVAENPMYISVLLVCVAFVIAAFRYIMLENTEDNGNDGGISQEAPDVDLPLPPGVSAPKSPPKVNV